MQIIITKIKIITIKSTSIRFTISKLNLTVRPIKLRNTKTIVNFDDFL